MSIVTPTKRRPAAHHVAQASIWLSTRALSYGWGVSVDGSVVAGGGGRGEASLAQAQIALLEHTTEMLAAGGCLIITAPWHTAKHLDDITRVRNVAVRRHDTSFDTHLARTEALHHLEEAVARPWTIATDGSAGATQRWRSGWAWVASDGSWASGTHERDDSNTAELVAITRALQRVDPRAPVHLLCDSQAALRALDEFAHGNTAAFAALAGHRTGQQLAEVLRNRRAALTTEWVKGHSGHPLNECADRLALLARRTSRAGSPPCIDLAADIVSEHMEQWAA